MHFAAKEDVSIPISDTFDLMTDFDRLERSALRRGAEISRVSEGDADGVGMAWELRFHWRGNRVKMQMTVVESRRPEELKIEARSKGLDSDIKIDLVSLARERTRISLTADVTAKTLTARLLLHSLKLARGRVDTRLGERLAAFGRLLEERHQAVA